MQRVGFLLKVRPEKLEEYKRLHSPIWPELAAALKAAGMRNYSLWLRPDGLEFGYLECDNWKETCDRLAKSDVHTRWQEMMRDFLETPNDPSQAGQPVQMLEMSFLLQ